MKRAIATVLFAVAAASAITTPGTVFAGRTSTLNFGLGTSDFLPHCRATVYLIEYEHLLRLRLSGLARFIEGHYDFDNGERAENGRPKGLEIGARYYFRQGMKGFYIGGVLGYWRSEWSFIENASLPGAAFSVVGHFNAVRLGVDVGARIPIGKTPFSVTPSLNFGRFFPHSSCDYTAPGALVGLECTQESEVKNNAFLAVTGGLAF